MGKTFIKKLTDFINNNRKDIRITLKLSTILTASIMGFIAFQPFFISTATSLLILWNSVVQHSAWLASEVISAIFVSFKATILLLIDVVTDIIEFFEVFSISIVHWVQPLQIMIIESVTATSQFFSLPAGEIVNKTIDTLGYFITSIIIFICLTVLIFASRNSVLYFSCGVKVICSGAWILCEEAWIITKHLLGGKEQRQVLWRALDKASQNRRFITQVTPSEIAIIKEYRDKHGNKQASE